MRRRVSITALIAAIAALPACGAAVGGHGSAVAPSPVRRTTAATAARPAVASVQPPVSGPARFADPIRAAAIRAAAAHDVAVVSTFDYRRLPQALAAGLTVSTGAFREQYRTAFGSIRTGATAAHSVQTASVTATGLGPSGADRATVLVFGQTAAHSTAAGSDRLDPFTARVDLSLVGRSWLIDGLTLDGAIDGAPAGPPALAAAVAAARRGVADVLTYRRSSFAADFARALSRTTGRLRTDLAVKRADTHDAMTGGRFDLVGGAPAVGVVAASADVVVVLVAATETQSGPGRTPVTTRQRLQVTLRLELGSWRLSDAAAVGLR